MIRELGKGDIAECANILVPIFCDRLVFLTEKTGEAKKFVAKALSISKSYKIIDVEKNRVRGVAIAEIVNNEPYFELAKLCLREMSIWTALKTFVMALVSQMTSPRIPGPEAFLLVVGVKESEQGKGIGTRLLKKMESDLKKKKVPQVGLFASTENPEAVDFYLRNGYAEVKKFGSVMGRYIYMRKKL